MNYEIPLALFTTLTQAAVGLSLFTVWGRFSGGAAASPQRCEWLLVWLLAAAGLVFSLLHLGKPLMAPTAIKNLGVAWLSREVLIFGVFAVMAFLCLVLKAPKILGAATAATGLLGVITQGMTYAAPAMPAINNAWPLCWFALAALVCGAALFMVLGHNGKSVKLMLMGCALFLLLLLGIPALWLGNESSIVRETAGLWLAAPPFWAAVVCLALAAVSAAKKLDAKISLALCVAGVFLSRLVFFGATVHAATNIGGVY